MSKENYAQAILTKQGRKALEKKGDTAEHSDTEVRRKGLGRLLRRSGALATAAIVVFGVARHGVESQDKVNAAQVKQDNIAFNNTIYGQRGHGESDSSTGSTPATSPEAGDTSNSAQSSEAAEPETSSTDVTDGASTEIPAQGDWRPTPGAVPEQPSPAATESAEASTSVATQQPETGGVNGDNPSTGGIDAK